MPQLRAFRHIIKSLTCGAGLALWASFAHAQSVQSPLPLTQVQDGITITLDKAGFYHERDFTQRWLGGSTEPDRPAFMIGYTVKVPKLKPEQTILSMPNEAKVRLFSPQGEPLYQRMIARSNNGGVEKWEDVAPWWDHVAADFAWPDPTAPVGADGRFTSSLEFKRVPVPPTLDVPVTVNRLLATPRGTELYLEKVMRRKAEGNGQGDTLDITVSWECAPDLTDTSVELEPESMTDSGGKALATSGSTSRQGNVYTFPHEPLPPADSKTFNFTLKVAETIPSLQQPQWFKHFRFDLKLPASATLTVPPAPALPGAPAVTQVAEAAGVVGELESNSASDNEFQGRLWLRARRNAPLNPPLDPLSAWAVKSIIGHDGAGHEFKSGWEANSSDHLFWKLDGSPAVSGETDQSLMIYFSDQKKPAQLTVTAEVEMVRHWHQVFDFSAIPIPAPGQTKLLHQAIQATGPTPFDIIRSAVTLRQITSFKSPAALMGLDAEQRAKLQSVGGLALVFEVTPALGPDAKQELALGLAADGQGRDVPGNSYTVVAPGNLFDKTPPSPYTWTVLLMLPNPDATTLRAQVSADEILPIGPARTLTFKDVALPAPPAIFL